MSIAIFLRRVLVELASVTAVERSVLCTVIMFVNDWKRCRSRFEEKKKKCVTHDVSLRNFRKCRFYTKLIIHRLSTSLNDTIICIRSKIAQNFLDD